MSDGAKNVLEPGGSEFSTAAGGARPYRKPLKSFRWIDIKSLLEDSVSGWNRNNATRLGAALAFYALLSLAPLLLIVVSIVGLVFGQRAAQNDMIRHIHALAGPAAAKAIQGLLEGSRNTTHGIIATVAGVLMLLFGASAVLAELRDALNIIWEVPTPELSGIRMITSFLKDRLFSFALVLALGLVLVISLAISIWIAALNALSISIFPEYAAAILHFLNVLISFMVFTGLFAATYMIIPNVKLEWREVILGGAVTSLLFTIGKLMLNLYLGKASFASTYGATGSLVVLIVWVYYSSQIFFLGAEFTRTFANRYGSQPRRSPKPILDAAKMAQEPTLEPQISIPPGATRQI